MNFDSNLAWKQATSAIAANREVLLALSGVFLMLPSLAFALFFPSPEPAAGQSEQQTVAAMQAYYLTAMPALIPMALIQAAGTLALLTLFTDKSRPTVGEAIRRGFTGMPSYFAAQILLGIGIGVVGGSAIAIGAVTGAKAVVALTVVAAVLAAVYAAIKTSLVAPIIAVEGVLNPVAALQRSWRLTKGNSVRIGLFYLLLLLAMAAVMLIAMMIVGVVLAAVAGPETTRVVGAVVSSALGATATLYFVAVLATVHRQLAGPSPEKLSAPFE